MQLNYRHTKYAAYIGYITQAIVNNLPALLFVTFNTAYGISLSFLQAVIHRIPSLRIAGNHLLEICSGPNCGKHAALAVWAEQQHRRDLTIKFVPCMRQCGKGPNIRLDGRLYHSATVALLESLMRDL
jgi:NADH:ubiquinone oxidoreductase subunit E